MKNVRYIIDETAVEHPCCYSSAIIDTKFNHRLLETYTEVAEMIVTALNEYESNQTKIHQD